VFVTQYSAGLLLEVPYYSQRDNKRQPERTCFSSACAMLCKYLRPDAIRGDDDYIERVFRYGDTTLAESQIKALQSFGIKARFDPFGSRVQLLEHLAKRIPVPVGYIHNGPVEKPTGGGHWALAIGYTSDRSRLIVHDPGGDPDLINGGFLTAWGKQRTFTWLNFGPRFLPYGNRSGYMILADP
jgi:hypothetical protein